MALLEMQKRLEGKIKMEFEVERLDPLFATTKDYEEFSARHAQHQVPVKDLATTEERHSLESMQVLPPQKLPWSEKTVLFCILFIIIMKEIRLAQPFLPSRIFMTSCRKVWRLSTPALPVTVRH